MSNSVLLKNPFRTMQPAKARLSFFHDTLQYAMVSADFFPYTMQSAGIHADFFPDTLQPAVVLADSFHTTMQFAVAYTGVFLGTMQSAMFLAVSFIGTMQLATSYIKISAGMMHGTKSDRKKSCLADSYARHSLFFLVGAVQHATYSTKKKYTSLQPAGYCQKIFHSALQSANIMPDFFSHCMQTAMYRLQKAISCHTNRPSVADRLPLHPHCNNRRFCTHLQGGIHVPHCLIITIFLS